MRVTFCLTKVQTHVSGSRMPHATPGLLSVVCPWATAASKLCMETTCHAISVHVGTCCAGLRGHDYARAV